MGTPAASLSAAPQLKDAIEKRWGSYDAFEETFSKTLLGIQGSGWGWLVKDKNKGILSIETTKDQDPVIGDKIPIFGVDMWEHAYYVQVSCHGSFQIFGLALTENMGST